MEKNISIKESFFDIKKLKSVNTMVKISFLSVISYVLMILEFPIPLFPSFLTIDLSDLPALIGAFAFGPMAGIIVELLKNILHLLTKSMTGGVGELANFIVGSALIVPASIFYLIKRKRSYALLGMIVGTITMAMVGGLVNYFILIPFYAQIMPIEQIIALGTAVNGAIVDLKTLILYAVVPFNILKGVVISILTLLMYKKISHIFK